jgi:hypothetical protein
VRTGRGVGAPASVRGGAHHRCVAISSEDSVGDELRFRRSRRGCAGTPVSTAPSASATSTRVRRAATAVESVRAATIVRRPFACAARDLSVVHQWFISGSPGRKGRAVAFQGRTDRHLDQAGHERVADCVEYARLAASGPRGSSLAQISWCTTDWAAVVLKAEWTA